MNEQARPLYYILVNGRTVAEPNAIRFGNWMENNDRCVERTEVGNRLVSTVFLGIDHSFGSGKPLLFETMVFGDDWHGEDTWRYSTLEEAKAGHAEVVRQIEQGEDPE